MVCTRKIPEECFSCPFEDCTASNNPTREENKYLDVTPSISRLEYLLLSDTEMRALKRKQQQKEWREKNRDKMKAYFKWYAREKKEKGVADG
jgi:hypothetical protein